MTEAMDWDSRIGRRLKLRDLHVLAAVVRWGSMAKAAPHLGMSQSVVSESVAPLYGAPAGLKLTLGVPDSTNEPVMEILKLPCTSSVG